MYDTNIKEKYTIKMAKNLSLEVNFGADELKTEFGFPASHINQELLKEFAIPNQIRDEIPTLNKFGYMKIDMDEFCQEFINQLSIDKGLGLELGTAYGFVTLEALKQGCRIIASDISDEHLAVLLKKTPIDQLKNLFLYPARFPNEISLPDNSINAVLTSRMMHFLDIEEIEQGLDKIYKWLSIDGKLYFVSVAPYHASLRDAFLPIYEDRVKKEKEWPGRIDSQWDIAPVHKQFVPEFLHVFDVPQLENLLPKHGFKIEKIKLFDYPKDFDSDGKGHIGFIATKIEK